MYSLRYKNPHNSSKASVRRNLAERDNEAKTNFRKPCQKTMFAYAFHKRSVIHKKSLLDKLINHNLIAPYDTILTVHLLVRDGKMGKAKN